MTLTAAASHDLGACAWSLSGRWDLLSPPNPPGLIPLPLTLSVPGGCRSGGAMGAAGRFGPGRCKLHGGLPSLR